MKQRAIDLAIAKRRAEIAAKKEEISKRASLVLSFSDVKKAHDNYVSWAFKNARGGFDDEEKLAKQGYIDALKKHGENPPPTRCGFSTRRRCPPRSD